MICSDFSPQLPYRETYNYLSFIARSASKEENMPYRGVDSTFKSRHCSSGEAVVDPDTGLTIGVEVTTSEETCNHYEPEELAHIPTIQQNVKAALDVLSKDDDGFFLMYEQGDIDWR